MAPSQVVVAVDTGGTFTDAVALIDGQLRVHKAPSTPHDPSVAIARAVRALAGERRVDLLIHGTTVATNALLERRGADTWLVTSEGHEDVLHLARQRRPALFALAPRDAPPLVSRAQTIGVIGRWRADGQLYRPLNLDPLRQRLVALDERPRSWAVSLLHSYACDEHERAVAQLLEQERAQDTVTLSADVLPLFREFERTATTAASAFVAPVMAQYLAKLATLATSVQVMSSSGGRLSLASAARNPAATALSGPAGGVVAASQLAASSGAHALGFDMGGTSTDVAVCGADTPLRHAAEIGGVPVHLPTVDIHTIGAGGGSIAWIDAGGALRVGPQSAGATPGPACYGQGTLPTVTDANVVLGHLPRSTALAGGVQVDAARADAAVQTLADALGVSVDEAARGVLRVANAAMAQALRHVTVQRGVDPRALPLICFGGAGALHACDLADEVGCPEVWVPHHAGVFSAVGLLLGPQVAERSKTVLGRSVDELAQLQATSASEVRAQLGAEATLRQTLEMRYAGQSFALEVLLDAPVTEASFAAAADAFEQTHLARFGFRADATVVAVTFRVRAEIPAPIERMQQLAEARAARAPLAPVTGPAAIPLETTTIWVAEGWVATEQARHICLTRTPMHTPTHQEPA